VKKLLSLALALLLLTACGAPAPASTTAPPETTAPPTTTVPTTMPPTSGLPLYADLRYIAAYPDYQPKVVFEAHEYDRDWMHTYTFNESMSFSGSEDLQAQILEEGKNPGLGVRSLHAQSVTGEGVNVAIIDQNLLLNHPEFAGKITAYYDSGCDQPDDQGSMHAPAVVSLLVGETIGVAPGAKVYFGAAPSWTGDSAYFAECLNWIIAENEKLPDGEKIRVVSVSAAPSGVGSPYTMNQEMWDEAVLSAQKAGILVLDCRENSTTGIIGPAYYDRADRESPVKCSGGFPPVGNFSGTDWIGVPNAYRTMAEEYIEGEPSYQYWGKGGLSWAIPYAAGVLALGWQVNPELSGEQMVELLFETCATGANGANIIDPVAFIAAVQETVK